MSDEIDDVLDTPTEFKQAPKGISSLFVGKLERVEKQKEEVYEGEVLIVKDEKEEIVMKSTKEFQDIKVYVEKKYSIPFSEQKVFVGDKQVADTLCLNDVKQLGKDKENIITIKV